MPAVIEATRGLAHRVTRPETPTRLRLLVALTTITAAVLLVAASLLMARTQRQVRVIGDEAAPQAATAADLYFALSDMDAQVARIVLSGDDDSLAATQIDALGTYRERSGQVDADVQRTLTTATGAAGRATALTLLDDLAVYRERVWQTLTTAGDKHGYYTQATNQMHLSLLPAAQRLRDSSESRLAGAYSSKDTTEAWGMTLTVVLGALLIVLLLALQVWLARRFRRVLNPALLAATVITLLFAVPCAAIFAAQGRRLAEARDDSLVPYLALSEARAISYDAAADTSRYLISGNAAYRKDFDRKAACLAATGDCDAAIRGGLVTVAAGPDVSPDLAGQVMTRWNGYRADDRKIIGLADAGRSGAAVATLTGIQRGDATFDFSYYDDAVGRIATSRKAAFDDALRATKRLLVGWSVAPLVAMGLVLVLVPVGVRRRLAEYR